MHATDDQNWRAISIWQHGLPDLLPEEIHHGIIGCTVDGDGYGILMENLSDTLQDDGMPISLEDHQFILESMARYHATFWMRSELSEDKYNLSKPEGFFTHTSPIKARQFQKYYPPFVYEMITKGHQALSGSIHPDLSKVTDRIVRDPEQFCQKLSEYPYTLVHSDVRRANLGIQDGTESKLVMLDWARPTATVSGVDLIYYLKSLNLSHLPTSIEASIDHYQHSLAGLLGDRYDASWWEPQLELSMLGVFATMGCFGAYFVAHSDSEERRLEEQEELAFWADLAAKGLKWLS